MKKLNLLQIYEYIADLNETFSQIDRDAEYDMETAHAFRVLFEGIGHLCFNNYYLPLTRGQVDMILNAIGDSWLEKVKTVRAAQKERREEKRLHPETPSYLNPPEPVQPSIKGYILLAELDQIKTAFKKDLVNIVVLELENEEETGYYEHSSLISDDIAGRFPEENKEFIEAAKCFATMRYTATVFHLTRAIESLAGKFGVYILGNSYSLDGKKLDNILNDIEKELRKQENPQGQTLTDADRKTIAEYSDATIYFKRIVKAWRNPVAHGEWFEDYEARVMLSFFVSFVQSLAKFL